MASGLDGTGPSLMCLRPKQRDPGLGRVKGSLTALFTNVNSLLGA